MPTLTAEQLQQIVSMKGQLELIFAIVRNCSDLEAADDIARAAKKIKDKLAVLEGTPAKYPVRVAA